MRWLIRLYPRRWRELYGEEFEALLQQRPPTLRDVLDIVRSALDARLAGRTGQAWRPPEDRLYAKGERGTKVKRTFIGLGIGVTAGAFVLAAHTAGFWPFARGAPVSGTAPVFQLYRLDQSHGVRLLPIDPTRLTGIRHGRGITLETSNANGSPFEILQSDDGRAIAAVWATAGTRPLASYVNGTVPCDTVPTGRCREVVRVFAAHTGAVRASFNLPLGAEVQSLSRDGTKLFGTGLRQSRTRSGWHAWSTWYTISAANGRMVSKVDLPSQCSSPTLYDAVHGRLYALEASQRSVATTPLNSAFGEGAVTDETVLLPPEVSAKPGPPSLVACALASSRQVTRLALKGVAYGSWSGQSSAYQSWTPGFALSPNGRQIAVYDGRTNRLTLVDALRMRILRVESLSRPQSLVSRLAEWLGVAPTDAWAKGQAAYGADLQMRYSPDGRRLYVIGAENAPHASGACICLTRIRRMESIGIRAIDVGRGEITGDSLRGYDLGWVQPAPDGGALYAFSPFGDDSEALPIILRLNPTTLQVMGQRVVTLHSANAEVNPQYYVLAPSTP